MAIDDLIGRIEGDATEEAATVIKDAKASAKRLKAAAKDKADLERIRALEEARRRSAEESETLLANARLAARDRLLSAKRERAERVLVRAQQALEALPDAEYVDLIASAVARTAGSGETLSIAAADSKRLAGLAARLESLGVRLKPTAAAAPLDRGVLIEGDRLRVEVSPASLVADSRDRLLLVAARELFGGKD